MLQIKKLQADLVIDFAAAELKKYLRMMMPTRPQSAAWRILLRHTEFCDRLAQIMTEKAQGHDKLAWDMLQVFFDDFGKYDLELERWFDFGMWGTSIKGIVKQTPQIEL